MDTATLDDAYQLLDASLLHYRGRPVGMAAADEAYGPVSANYRECFVRDFVVAGLVYLADGKVDIVRNFLLATLEITEREHGSPEQTIHPSVMPASFRVRRGNDGATERLEGDFGEQAIGRVAPVDSIL